MQVRKQTNRWNKCEDWVLVQKHSTVLPAKLWNRKGASEKWRGKNGTMHQCFRSLLVNMPQRISQKPIWARVYFGGGKVHCFALCLAVAGDDWGWNESGTCTNKRLHTGSMVTLKWRVSAPGSFCFTWRLGDRSRGRFGRGGRGGGGTNPESSAGSVLN